MNSPILFLNVEGVMTSHATFENLDIDNPFSIDASDIPNFDPKNIRHLNRIIEAVAPKIVIITEMRSEYFAPWDEQAPLEKLQHEFQEKGGLGELSDETSQRTNPNDTECPLGITTEEVIDEWIEDRIGQDPDHPECTFAILDYRDDLDKYRDRLVQTNDRVGLTDQDADRVIELLRG